MSASKALLASLASSSSSSSVRRQAVTSTIRQCPTTVMGPSCSATPPRFVVGVALRPSPCRGMSTSTKPKTSAPPQQQQQQSEFPEPNVSTAENDNKTTMKNVVMAIGLLGFVASVFTYSMNAVGRGDEIAGASSGSSDSSDPLAQLRAEAQEARQMEKYQNQGKVMSKEEIHALETGRTNVDDDAQAMADALEAEASRTVFQQQQQQDEKKVTKKSWWRFGF